MVQYDLICCDNIAAVKQADNEVIPIHLLSVLFNTHLNLLKSNLHETGNHVSI